MNGKEYQNLAMRTNDGNGTYRLKSFANTQDFYREELLLDIDAGGILNACLGLSGEVGEFNDMIKKWIFHEKDLDELNQRGLRFELSNYLTYENRLLDEWKSKGVGRQLGAGCT